MRTQNFYSGAPIRAVLKGVGDLTSRQADRERQESGLPESVDHDKEYSNAGDERKHKRASAAPRTCSPLSVSSHQALQMVWSEVEWAP